MKSSIGLPFGFVSRSVLFEMAALGINLLFASRVSSADPGKNVVQVDQSRAKIGPMFYGLITGEISRSHDCGPAKVDTIAVTEPMKVTPKISTIDASAKSVREIPGHSDTNFRISTK